MRWCCTKQLQMQLLFKRAMLKLLFIQLNLEEAVAKTV